MIIILTGVDTLPVDIALISTDRQHIINVGDSVDLDCRFTAVNYYLFDYPVLWRKRQLDEDVQINVMGNINEPFLAGRRFEVTFNSSSSPTAARPARVYSLQLSVSGQIVASFITAYLQLIRSLVFYDCL